MLPALYLLLALVGLPFGSTTPSYDFVIIGGGAGGLVLANRLTEDGTKHVLVLEAGQPRFDDPRILIPGKIGGTLGDPDYDWVFTTVPQIHANNRVIRWSRAIAKLGNPGWTWNNLFKYIKKSETFSPPSAADAAQNNYTYILANHGTTGPVKNSFSKFVTEGQVAWTTALESLGIKTLVDALGGDDVGAWYAPAVIDAKTQTFICNNCTNFPAYYLPAANRSNLNVIMGAEASRIVTSISKGVVTATDVENFLDGVLNTIRINNRAVVILSAGAINTPKILELSRIGDPSVLTPLGIPVRVNLPGVGSNMVDQVIHGASYELKDNTTITLDSLSDPVFAAQALAEYEANKTGIYILGITAYAFVSLQKITDAVTTANIIATQKLRALTGGISHATQKLWKVQFKQLLDHVQYGLVELVVFLNSLPPQVGGTPVPGKKYITFTVHQHFPFSRGSIHISSTNHTIQPRIDPNYLSEDFDLQVLLQSHKYVRKLAVTGHFADLLVSEIHPGTAISTDEDLISYIRKSASTEYHTIGTSAMMPRWMGGVVSSELKVYGTSNIRVVDLSILPLQISAHPQSTMYGIAEKAADIIRGLITV